MSKYRVMFVLEVIARSEADAIDRIDFQHNVHPEIVYVESAALKISDAKSMERKNHATGKSSRKAKKKT